MALSYFRARFLATLRLTSSGASTEEFYVLYPFRTTFVGSENRFGDVRYESRVALIEEYQRLNLIKGESRSNPILHGIRLEDIARIVREQKLITDSRITAIKPQARSAKPTSTAKLTVKQESRNRNTTIENRIQDE